MGIRELLDTAGADTSTVVTIGDGGPGPRFPSFYVTGRWHNDSTAGVSVECRTCEQTLAEGPYEADGDEELAVDAVIAACRQHVCPGPA